MDNTDNILFKADIARQKFNDKGLKYSDIKMSDFFRLVSFVCEEIENFKEEEGIHTMVISQRLKANNPVFNAHLQVAVEEAKKVTEEELSKVVPAVVEEFKAALAEAEVILADENATQVSVDQSFDRLSKAMQMLSFEKGNKEQLQQLVDRINQLDASEYIDSTWAKLQVALDTLTLQDCIALLEETKGSVDIAEVGTPFVIEEGMVPVKEFKKRFPNIEVLADVKIMDAGKYEADKCFDAGADIVTVLGVSHDETIKGVVESAANHHKKVMVDMIAVENLEKRTKEIDQMGVDYICVHTAFDVQSLGQDPLDDLKTVNRVIQNAKSAVAGGVKLQTVDAIVQEGCEIVVVGGAICNAKDRSAYAKEIKEHLK